MPNPYKKTMNQKNGSLNQGPHPGGSSAKKGDKIDEAEKIKRIY